MEYDQVTDLVEGIAEAKARQFRKIAWLDDEDIKQEVRIKCLSVLGKYDPGRADLESFLSRCADNRLRDLRRGAVYKHNKPCFRCPLWDKAAYKHGEHDCTAFSDKMDCDKFARHERYVQAKLSAGHPVDLDEDRLEDDSVRKGVERSELIEFFRSNVPPEYMDDFEVFEDSGFELRSIKPQRRVAFVEIMVSIMCDYQQEFYDE